MSGETKNNNTDNSELEKLSELIRKNKKSSGYIAIIGVIAALIGFTVSITNVFHLTNEKAVIVDSLNKKDSIITKIDSVQDEKQKIGAIAERYIAYRNSHAVDTLESLYADTLAQYFLLKNASKEEVSRSDRIYWKRHTKDRFNLNPGAFQITGNTDYYQVLITGRQCRDGIKCIDEIIEIHIDRNNKINYVRAYYTR